MTFPHFALKNGTRNKVRLTLTIFSIGFSLFLLTSLLNIMVLLDGPTSDDSTLRLAVRRKSSLADSMPSSYLQKLRGIPGVRHVMPFTWFQGIFGNDDRNFFANFTCDPYVLFDMFREIQLSESERNAFQREKAACIVGNFTANRFKWKVGDRISLVSQIHFTPDGDPVTIDLVIRGIFTATQRGLDENLFFHDELFEQANGRQGKVGTYWLKVENSESIPMVCSLVDATFRNTAAETKTETEKAFAAAFQSMLGNVKLLLGSISAIVTATILLVVSSTMAMNIRERAPEIATLRTLGFSRALILRLLIGESVVISLIGGILGVGGAWIFYSTVDLATANGGMIQSFDVEPVLVPIGLAVAVLIGVMSAGVPAWFASRSSILSGLRQMR